MIIARILLWMIAAYRRLLSPLLGQNCRFHPSCSAYAGACIERFGARKGVWLATLRLSRCHPWHAGGYDPPPATDLTQVSSKASYGC